MTNVQEIDGLIAIVSVIRPGAANESKKLSFTRRYQGMEAVTYPHPSLEPCLRSTYGLVVYEENILQICEDFAGLPADRADVVRRALVKQKRGVVQEIGQEFAATAHARGHDEAKIAEVGQLVTGFSGYAFNKAHSTAYGVEAYQAAWLKRYHPAEFMAGVLTKGRRRVGDAGCMIRWQQSFPNAIGGSLLGIDGGNLTYEIHTGYTLKT